MPTDIANVPGKVLDTQAQLLARSASFMPAGFGWVYDELDTAALTSNWQQAGTWGVSAAKGVGCWSALSSAAQVLFRQPVIVANPAVTRWHIAGRMLVSVAIAAADVKGFGLTPFGDGVANTCHVGVRQATSATKYVFTALKASVAVTALSTVTYDNNFHVFELWFDGTSMWGSVDSESPVLVTAAANLSVQASNERFGVENGTGAGTENFFDFTYYAAARTTT